MATVGKPLSIMHHEEGRFGIVFRGTLLFNLKADNKGIVPAAIGVDPKHLTVYNWEYRGQVAIDQSKPLLSIRETDVDSRGNTYVVEYKGSEVYSLIGTNEGYARGGHSHPYDVSLAMPMGSGIWQMLRRNKWTEIIQTENDEPLKVRSGEVHYIIATTDLLLTEVPAKGERFMAHNHRSREIVTQINRERDRILTELIRR